MIKISRRSKYTRLYFSFIKLKASSAFEIKMVFAVGEIIIANKIALKPPIRYAKFFKA